MLPLAPPAPIPEAQVIMKTWLQYSGTIVYSGQQVLQEATDIHGSQDRSI